MSENIENYKEPDFSFFTTTLAIQASVCLGILPNPATNKKEENIQQARFIIDTLAMLKEKTKNNLNPEETKLIENILAELQVQYVNITNAKTKGEQK
ncbi:MAG: DUF1844 domain-containing protein [Candidatus Omnitrophica bacterium]|nr:DUF1844 domain-containing protein [Candidatus Omnitrophota bacterium]